MARRIYISSSEAEFFVTNTLSCASDVPVEGQHKIGDLVISNIQQNEVIGWVCIENGNPGKWQAIRNAGNWLQIKLEEINEEISEIRIFNENTTKELLLLTQNLNQLVEDNKEFIEGVNLSISVIDNDMKVIKNNLINHENKIKVIEEDIVEINSQILLNNQNITTLTKQVNSNTQHITNINKAVGENGVASKDSVDEVLNQIDKIKEMIGANSGDNGKGILQQLEELRAMVGASEGGNGKGILQQLEELRELIGVNAEGDEESVKGLMQKIEELRELVGLNADEGDEKVEGILQQLEELRDLVGVNAEEGEVTINNLVSQINIIKNIIGNVEENGGGATIRSELNAIKNIIGTQTPTTGLYKELARIHAEITDVRANYVKFWVGTRAQYQALTNIEHGRLYIITD